VFSLAAYDEYQDILRKEVMEQLADGSDLWSKETIGKLEKVDSFLREVMRLHGLVGGRLPLTSPPTRI
jgi:hypothetical protein